MSFMEILGEDPDYLRATLGSTMELYKQAIEEGDFIGINQYGHIIREIEDKLRHLEQQPEVKPNRVTAEHINGLLDHSETSEHIFWGKELVVSYKLPNGFSICGSGACVDPSNFDLEIGRSVAREDATNQLWVLEGYLLQQRLFEQTS